MRDSTTYQAILEEGRDEGRAEQTKRLILELASEKLGAIDESNRARLDELTNLERLERIAKRLLKATTWDDLLNTP